MPRIIDITVPPDETDDLLAEVQRIDGLIGLRIQRGTSIKPPGDLITAEVTNQSLHTLMQRLDERGVGRASNSSITTSQPKAIVSPSSMEAIAYDKSETTWEETETAIGRESNATVNSLSVMAISGIVAAIGIATGAIHLVIGAMVIAPGFEPITRISLGIVSQSAAWKRGLSHTGQAYGALILGAAVATLALSALGHHPLDGVDAYLASEALIAYWTGITAPSLLASATASIAGAVLIASDRTLLTAGVMIALALIPAATLVGMALVAGRWTLAGQAALRWIIEVGLVAAFALLVFAWKRARTYKRRMML